MKYMQSRLEAVNERSNGSAPKETRAIKDEPKHQERVRDKRGRKGDPLLERMNSMSVFCQRE